MLHNKHSINIRIFLVRIGLKPRVAGALEVFN